MMFYNATSCIILVYYTSTYLRRMSKYLILIYLSVDLRSHIL
jgi:hypothetical protein